MTDPHAHHTDHPTGKAATATGGDTRHGDHTPEPPTQHDTHTGHGTQASHGDHAGHDGGGHGGGHGGHGDHVGQFRRLFWINLIIAVPVVAFSPMFAMILGYTVPDWALFIAPVLGTVMYAWGGWPFLTGAVSELRSRKPGMMLLIGLAITVAFFASWGATLGLLHHELEFWWELALLIVIMLLGHWIEMRSLAQTSSALDTLAALLPDEAERVEGDQIVKVSPADLQVGDVVVVRPGGSVPADGKIVDGRADMDESMVTGESRPVARGTGDPVTAGTVATDSGLRVEVTATGDETTLAGIQRLVTEAQNSSSRAQRIADKAAALLFWFALGAAAITAVVWTVVGNPDAAVVRTITVLVIACPHALGLAVPLVVAISTTLGAQNGLLVRDRRGLEEARLLNVVVFDKTGTLTLGEFRVVNLAVADGVTEEDALRIAAGVEAESQHPIARGIVTTAQDRGIDVPSPEGFRSITGKGVAASVDGAEYHMGGPRLLEAEEAHVPEALRAAAAQASERGQAAIYLLQDGKALGVFVVADAVREESREAISALHERGIEVAMLTGDSWPVANAVAEELQIDTVFAEVLPEDKASKIRELQQEGRKVAMVGDGVNDAPALATADLGIAIGAGTDVAVEAGHIVLVRSDPRDIPRIVTLSRATYRKMMQNLWLAAGYNIVAIPLAAGVLAGWGILLTPALGAVLMSASTIVVSLNAQLLRRVEM